MKRRMNSSSAFLHQQTKNRPIRTVSLATRTFHSTRLLLTSEETPEDDTFFATHQSFEDLGIQSQVLRQRIPFAAPTKVQAATIARVQNGGDVTIGAETGSGKVSDGS